MIFSDEDIWGGGILIIMKILTQSIWLSYEILVSAEIYKLFFYKLQLQLIILNDQRAQKQLSVTGGHLNYPHWQSISVFVFKKMMIGNMKGDDAILI